MLQPIPERVAPELLVQLTVLPPAHRLTMGRAVRKLALGVAVLQIFVEATVTPVAVTVVPIATMAPVAAAMVAIAAMVVLIAALVPLRTPALPVVTAVIVLVRRCGARKTECQRSYSY